MRHAAKRSGTQYLDAHSHAQISAGASKLAAMNHRDACRHAWAAAARVIHQVLIVSVLMAGALCMESAENR